MFCSYTPCVDGYVIINAASSFASKHALSLKSCISMLPSLSHLIPTTFIPAITADAGFVPCADSGIRHTLRLKSDLDS